MSSQQLWIAGATFTLMPTVPCLLCPPSQQSENPAVLVRWHRLWPLWGRESDSEVRQSRPTLRLRGGFTPWTVAPQAPLSMGFSRKGYWSGLPFPSPGDPPNLGIEPGSPVLQADALPSEPLGKPQGHPAVLILAPRTGPGS